MMPLPLTPALFPYTTLFRSLFTAIVLSTIASAVTHYLFGGVRLQTPGEKVSSGARAHLSVLLGVFVLRSEEHTSELQSQSNLVCRLLLEKKKRLCRPQRAPA